MALPVPGESRSPSRSGMEREAQYFPRRPDEQTIRSSSQPLGNCSAQVDPLGDQRARTCRTYRSAPQRQLNVLAILYALDHVLNHAAAQGDGEGLQRQGILGPDRALQEEAGIGDFQHHLDNPDSCNNRVDCRTPRNSLPLSLARSLFSLSLSPPLSGSLFLSLFLWPFGRVFFSLVLECRPCEISHLSYGEAGNRCVCSWGKMSW
jgi:hypothetical protein